MFNVYIYIRFNNTHFFIRAGSTKRHYIYYIINIGGQIKKKSTNNRLNMNYTSLIFFIVFFFFLYRTQE